MRRLPLIFLLAGLTGCVTDNDSDPYPGEGPVVYDGGYYDAPRPIDYGVEQRAVYSPGYYYYPSAHPYYYGGYRRGYYDHDRHDHDDRRGDRDARGDDRQRDRSPAPTRGDGDAPRTRNVPDRPSKAAAENRASPSRSAGGERGGGPHGGGRR